MPTDDMVEHNLIRQCWCRPTIEDQGPAAVVVHFAFDGREHDEPRLKSKYGRMRIDG